MHRCKSLLEWLKLLRLTAFTQGCSEPRIPKGLSPDTAQAKGFQGPVVHSYEFRQRLPELLGAGESKASGNDDTILVVGGGKSAQEYVDTDTRYVTRTRLTIECFVQYIRLSSSTREARVYGVHDCRSDASLSLPTS